MRAVYKFVAGNSYVTPLGIAVAAVLARAVGGHAPWAAPAYIAILLCTLAASTFERVQ